MAYTSALFKEETPAGFSTTGGVGGLAKFLVPNGADSSTVDVVNNYPWTLSDKADRTETPSVILTEFRLLQSALVNSARYFVTGAAQQTGVSTTEPGTGNPFLENMRGYAGLFDFKNPTGFWYNFPYFSEVSNEVSSTWATLDILDKVKSAASTLGIGEAVETIGNVAMFGYETNYPRVGVMDRPKLWEQSTPRNITIKFPLYNTIKYEDIQKNWDLCYLLLYQNMYNKRDFITAIPPVFYTAYVPGQFFSIAMYVSDLKIYNRGNIRRLSITQSGAGDGGTFYRNIPDVYEIEMTLTDMIMPSQNMLSQLRAIEPVTVQKINNLNPSTES
jgi:hypothetical protein